MLHVVVVSRFKDTTLCTVVFLQPKAAAASACFGGITLTVPSSPRLLVHSTKGEILSMYIRCYVQHVELGGSAVYE